MADIGRRGKGASERRKKGGASRPGIQESLEELTRLADDLVDSLEDEQSVDEAPAEQAAAAEEIFLDLDDDDADAVGVVIEEPADEPEIAESASTPETLEAPEEFEVVEPGGQPSAEAVCRSEVPVEDDGAALQETLEELDLIGQQEPPTVQRFEVEFAGDKGQDIDAHLDTLFGSETTEQPSELPSEPPTEVAAEPAGHSFEELNDTEADDVPVEQVAVAPESRDIQKQDDVPESAPSIFDEIEDTPQPAAETTDFQVALQGSEPPAAVSVTDTDFEKVGMPHEPSRSRRWLAVAAVFVVVTSVGAWWLFSRTSGDSASTEPAPPDSSVFAAEAIVPVETETPTAIASEPAVPVETRAPAPAKPKPVAPVKKPAPATIKVAAPVEKPAPPPVKVAAPVEKPAPATIKVAAPVERPAPPPVKVAAPVEKPAPTPVKPAAPVEKPAPMPVKVAALVEPPAPAPVETEPTLPVVPATPEPRVEPPEVVTRTEPVLTKRSRGEQGTVALKVLVNERGQVVRVVIDQGIPGSELEAAAIDAILRWKYRPGTENGRPVRAWVTETFVFEP